MLTVRLLWNVGTGDVSVKNLSGPINIADTRFLGTTRHTCVPVVPGNRERESFRAEPAAHSILDGGQIVYQLAELVKGSPLSERTQAAGQKVASSCCWCS